MYSHSAFDPLSLVRPAVRAMQGYTPGEQILGAIKLNTNESPFPPGPGVASALADYASRQLRVYPGPRADQLRALAGEMFDVAPEMILAGNGSDDLLTIVVRTFVDAHESIAVPWPTYGLYDTLAAIQGARVQHVPFAADWSLPPALAQTDAKVIFVSNPNNPSGTVVPTAALIDLLQARQAIVVVDEAYADFSAQTMLSHLVQYPNLIVTRSFSKSYSLAGARLGLLFAHPSLIAQLMKVKDSYNVNALTQALGIAALKDRAYLAHTLEVTLRERAFLEVELSDLGLHWPPSGANFLLVDCGSVARAQAAFLALREANILVRYWADEPRLASALRITVGTRPQNQALLAVLRPNLSQNTPKT